jgi:hypothetical protein
MQNDWTKPAALAIPEGGFFKDGSSPEFVGDSALVGERIWGRDQRPQVPPPGPHPLPCSRGGLRQAMVWGD